MGNKNNPYNYLKKTKRIMKGGRYKGVFSNVTVTYSSDDSAEVIREKREAFAKIAPSRTIEEQVQHDEKVALSILEKAGFNYKKPYRFGDRYSTEKGECLLMYMVTEEIKSDGEDPMLTKEGLAADMLYKCQSVRSCLNTNPTEEGQPKIRLEEIRHYKQALRDDPFKVLQQKIREMYEAASRLEYARSRLFIYDLEHEFRHGQACTGNSKQAGNKNGVIRKEIAEKNKKEIIKLHKKGYMAKQIVSKSSLSIRAVQGVLKEHRDKEAVKLFAKGKTIEAIAQELKTTEKKVKKALSIKQ